MGRILIVEDEALIGMMLADWIVELGHEAVGPAESVQDALNLIKTENPGAAILDVNLQGQRCDRVADELSANRIPIAFATGSHADTIESRFSDAPTLMKPYAFEAVRSVVIALFRQMA